MIVTLYLYIGLQIAQYQIFSLEEMRVSIFGLRLQMGAAHEQRVFNVFPQISMKPSTCLRRRTSL